MAVTTSHRKRVIFNNLFEHRMYIKQGRDRPTDNITTVVVLIRKEHMILFSGSNSWFRNGNHPGVLTSTVLRRSLVDGCLTHTNRTKTVLRLCQMDLEYEKSTYFSMSIKSLSLL